MQRLRQTSVDHVHGIWLQCSRRHWLPDHRFAARTPDCDHNKQFCPLQRAIPNTDCNYHDVLYWRSSRYICIAGIHTVFDRCDHIGCPDDVFVSALLSKTVLKGIPSSFTLELPPYRRPQIGRVIIRSIFDRTLFVLGRAVAVAAPAGLIIWLLANLQMGGVSLLAHCAAFLDPFAQLLGLDGVILMAFILGFPANEIVVPIMIMTYLSTGSIQEFDNLTQLKTLLVDNGWTWLTAVCTMLFSLMHWPCSTTCLTIRKETQSWKWTVVSILIPTIIGMTVCFLVASAARLTGLV